MEKIKSLKGVNDILPEEASMWSYITGIARSSFSYWGYEEIILPIIEESRLFVRGIGEQTDIVEKELYAFTDKGGRNISLRPEATASTVRAYLEHSFDQKGVPARFFYCGPMFRGEKPQSGRNRQFYQFGVEVLGADSPLHDVEVIIPAWNFLNKLGLKKTELIINSVGCAGDKENYSRLLLDYVQEYGDGLCKNCQERAKRNVLRILDCKNPACREVLRRAPRIIDNLCAECTRHFSLVQTTLEDAEVGFKVDPYLVRGLDYYTRTVFEIHHSGLGAQSAICAGGRYDNLIAELGGRSEGAAGFAFGMERTLLAVRAEDIDLPVNHPPRVYAIALGESARLRLFSISRRLRQEGVSVVMNYEDKSLKAQMRQADKQHSPYVLLLGQEELDREEIVLRDMTTAEQTSIRLETVVKDIKAKVLA